MKLNESGEMYLETIYILKGKTPYVRAIDICRHMGYSKPSVSRALGILKEGGYVAADNEGYLSLTEQGKEVAEKTYERHTLLTRFFVNLGVDEKTAAADACKIEHVISDETFAALKNHAKIYGK